ncbi:MAG: hypothetical protein ACREA9_21035 [Pyrinomonadaceae bacterium]
MAIPNWLGRALARAQLDTITFALTWAASDTATVTINGKSITYTAVGSSTTTAATALYTLLAASTITEFAAITWANPSNGVITATGTTAGVPFTLVASEVTAGNGTCAGVTTTAATGPNHWNNANNWDTGTVPVNGDTANVDLAIASIFWGLDQSAVTLASLNITTSSFTQNTLGLPRVNSSGYTEYLDQYLKISATAHRINTKSPRVKVNFGTVVTTGEVQDTGSPPDGTTPAVLLLGTNTSNVFDVVQGTVGLAYYDGESVNGSALTVGPAATVIVGTSGDFDSVTSSGTITYGGTGDEFQTAGGLAEIRGTPSFGLLDCNGGTTVCKFSGTVADVVVGPGRLDASQDNSARTFTDTMLMKGGQIISPQTINYTNGITLGPDVEQLTA